MNQNREWGLGGKEQRRMASCQLEAAWLSRLGHDVRLLSKHKLSTNFKQGPLCDQDGERQKQGHSIIAFEPRQK